MSSRARLRLEVETLEVRDQPSVFGSLVAQWFTPPRSVDRLVGTLGRFSLKSPAPASMTFRMLPSQTMEITQGILPGQARVRIDWSYPQNGNLTFHNASGQRVEVRIGWVGSTKPLFVGLLSNSQTLWWTPPAKPGYAWVTIIVNPNQTNVDATPAT